jgi:hypothetical protein
MSIFLTITKKQDKSKMNYILTIELMRTKQPKVTEIKEILLENFYYYFAQTIYNTQKNELEHIRDKYNINLS